MIVIEVLKIDKSTKAITQVNLATHFEWVNSHNFILLKNKSGLKDEHTISSICGWNKERIYNVELYIRIVNTWKKFFEKISKGFGIWSGIKKNNSISYFVSYDSE